MLENRYQLEVASCLNTQDKVNSQGAQLHKLA